MSQLKSILLSSEKIKQTKKKNEYVSEYIDEYITVDCKGIQCTVKKSTWEDEKKRRKFIRSLDEPFTI